jgi:hypothetical protein
LIQKITNPETFKRMANQIAMKFGHENGLYGHIGAKINPESLIKAWADSRLLNFNLHVWANEENGEFDSVIMFQGTENYVIGEKIWQEYLWVSKNPFAGIKLKETALRFGKSIGYKRYVMFSVENHPNSDKVKKHYALTNMKKDSEMYIGTL